MLPSSRTPEGEPLHCHVCGAESRMLVSSAGDSTCPCCGSLGWVHEPESQVERALAAEVAKTKVIVARFIRQLSKVVRQSTLHESADFYLHGITDCLAAHGAMLWLGEKRRWWHFDVAPELVRSYCYEDSSELARDVLQSGRSKVVERHAKHKSVVLIGVPLIERGKTVGVIEVAQRIQTSPAARRGYVRLIEFTSSVLTSRSQS